MKTGDLLKIAGPLFSIKVVFTIVPVQAIEQIVDMLGTDGKADDVGVIPGCRSSLSVIRYMAYRENFFI